MESNFCMNAQCGASTSNEWRKGWPIRSGEFASLCDKCGSAYEQLIFCDVFHSKESGWRECASCGKRLHCGCIASRFMIEFLDIGGVNCTSCSKQLGPSPTSINGKSNGLGFLRIDNVKELCSIAAEGHLANGAVEKMNFKHLFELQNVDRSQSFAQVKQEEIPPPANLDIFKQHIEKKDFYDLPAQPNLSISLGPSVKPGPFHDALVDERGKTPSIFQQTPRSRQLLPKPPNGGMVSQMRVARPPAEGRGKTQLLPRYWPRITDQELQQISGDPNSTIVPLFEKVLSASDAGRIGRLVLPKACAEAYFPPISQPEGLPLRIQDIKGKEWVFQFRFWPNNNSRMYVLEGVTPCIQSMQLQAGDTVQRKLSLGALSNKLIKLSIVAKTKLCSPVDLNRMIVHLYNRLKLNHRDRTVVSAYHLAHNASSGFIYSTVTFSRMEPEGKLVMGFRKATNSPTLQSFKGGSDTHLNMLSNNLNSTGSDIHWHKLEKNENLTKETMLLQSVLVPEKKRARNIGSKNKRLLIDSIDALELRLTWEEAQDLLRPPPSANPSIVTIEDHDFEEYDEPPVFGKRSVFIMRSTGEQEQWAQCDICAKWRKLPVDALLAPKWTCSYNIWDSSRASCSAPDELSPRELETLLRLNKEFKRRIGASDEPNQELDPSALDTLANAAITGANTGEQVVATVAATTKHPRHRPGCSCIVCIQPPSGKGKHKPSCTCTVCQTVKRRFKTLMMRKRKNQAEQEAEIAQKSQQTFSGSREETEADSVSKHHISSSENEDRTASVIPESRLSETGGGHIDLNCQPGRGEDPRRRFPGMSMMGLLEAASLPWEAYLKQNGLKNIASENQQAASTSQQAQPQVTTTGENEGQGQTNDEPDLAFPTQEQENGIDKTEPDQTQKESV